MERVVEPNSSERVPAWRSSAEQLRRRGVSLVKRVVWEQNWG